ncbi:unnamed protein product [Closterium sp. Yama58-4]|nr:unnamed protein product [Closterium sp. Yama58-4]
MLPGIAEDGPLGVAGAYDDALMASAADRQSHWGFHETKELIALRAEMERDFVPGRTSNHVWETISARMKEKGYRRTPNQCKCKWKVLVNRYKNKELSADGSRSCPFFEEVDAIFKQRARNMDRLLVQAEGGGTPGGIGASGGIGSGFSAGEGRAGAVGGTLGMRGSFGGGLGARGGAGGVGGSLLTRRARDEEEEEEEDEEEGDDDLEGELNVLRNKRRKRDFNAGARKAATGKGASAASGGGAGGDAFDSMGGGGNGGGDRRAVLERQRAGSMQEVLEQFFVQQLRLEQEWREAIERREAERRVREGEWRSRLEALERDRAQRESMWRQMEAERAAREDERAARRDQLIIALITKLSAPPAPPPAAPAPTALPATTPPAANGVSGSWSGRFLIKWL